MCISEAGTIHPWFSGAYLMWSSSHILLSLLPILGSLNRSLISWLLFCAVRFLWFFAYFLMTSVTYGMPKSLCKVTFDIYQGGFASFLTFWIETFGEFLYYKVCCIPTGLSHMSTLSNYRLVYGYFVFKG
jgi:hypothetical protein